MDVREVGSMFKRRDPVCKGECVVKVLEHFGKWISLFFRVLYMWTSEFFIVRCTLFFTNKIVSKIYNEGRVNRFSFLKTVRQEKLRIGDVSLTINLTAFFCSLNMTNNVDGTLPQKISPYFIMDRK